LIIGADFYIFQKRLFHLRVPAMLQKSVCAFLLLGLLFSCKKEQEPQSLLSAEARAHLEEVLQLMQQWSVNRKTINWESFTQRVYEAARNAQTVEDTYPAIQLALTLLEDQHSQYYTADRTLFRGDNPVTCQENYPVPQVSMNNPAIGYVKVPPFGGTAEQANQYMRTLQSHIRNTDHEGIRCWVVDLRGNLGGNMWPMLVGIGPILGEGEVGRFVDPEGKVNVWSYTGGTSRLDNMVLNQLIDSYRLRNPNPKVAVLTDRTVASSGEAVVIAFRGRVDTRSFGNPTCGLSTANGGFHLSNGAYLNLTVSTMADRNGNLYGKAVDPDELHPNPALALERAVAWLLE
jgi:carboxyl-terminal processing protease